jgi:predicted N-acetyltransferase YhbS
LECNAGLIHRSAHENWGKLFGGPPYLRFGGNRLGGAAVTDLILPVILPISTAAPDAVEALLDAAFGADRRKRTAYRLRDGLAPIADLSFAAFAEDRLVGTLQSWPVELAGPDGAIPLILVGPVAVAPDSQRRGIGYALMARLLATEAAANGDPMLLIGDAPYYGRFGFVADPARHWALPGPYELDRLLVRADADHSLPDAGTLTPRRG